MTELNVLVNISMNGGADTKCFRLKPSATISELRQAVKDREGYELDTFSYRGKPLKPLLTLSDIGFNNNGEIWGSIKLIGGASLPEGCNATQFNKHKVEKYGGSVVRDDCLIGWSKGCTESSILKCKFACGCIYCADCFRGTVGNQIATNGCTDITCGWTRHDDKSPAKIIDIQLAYAVCAYDEAKINEIDRTIQKNYSERPTAFMKPCYNCKKFVARKKNDASFIEECPGCHKWMCWSCGKAKHNEPSDCEKVSNIQALIDGTGNEEGMKDVNGRECWSRRVCINKECDIVNKHQSACNHMTCQCGQQYCHWCLQDWKGHKPSLCQVKGKEEKVTAEYLWGLFVFD